MKGYLIRHRSMGDYEFFGASETKNKMPIGCAVLNRADGSILHFLVDTPWRRRGVGTALLTAIRDMAKEDEIEALSLVTAMDNEPMNKLARTIGMRPWTKWELDALDSNNKGKRRSK